MSGIDFPLLAKHVEDVREVMRAMVAGLVSDGFTDREAREIVTSLISTKGVSE